MSIMHFDSTNAASDTETVELLNVFCFDIGITFAAADITTLAGGQVTCRRGGLTTTAFNWIDPLAAAPGNPVYEIMRGVATGDEASIIGPNAGVWTPVTSNPSFELTCSTTAFGPIIIREATFTVSIRQDAGPVIDTASWTLSIECATLN